MLTSNTKDATLTRCFGEKKKLADCDWSYLSSLETLAEPKQHMPRLVDLLAYLAQPENEHIWVLLDIKRDDDPDELLSATAAAISSIKPSRPWKDRIVLGPWTEHYIDVCRKHLPGYSIALINWSLSEASRLLRESDVGFNLALPSLVGPSGSRFIKETRKAGRNLFVWTVNQERWMHWSIRKGVDGVITDDPKKFLEIREQWKAGGGQRSTTVGQVLRQAFLQFMMTVFAPLVWYRVRMENRKRMVPVRV
jgi:phosphatidylglycerol phospholipase C